MLLLHWLWNKNYALRFKTFFVHHDRTKNFPSPFVLFFNSLDKPNQASPWNGRERKVSNWLGQNSKLLLCVSWFQKIADASSPLSFSPTQLLFANSWCQFKTWHPKADNEKTRLHSHFHTEEERKSPFDSKRPRGEKGGSRVDINEVGVSYTAHTRIKKRASKKNLLFASNNTPILEQKMKESVI